MKPLDPSDNGKGLARPWLIRFSSSTMIRISATSSASRSRKTGMTISTAQNGQEALRLFDRKPHQLVVLDIGMPEMDGLGSLPADPQDLGYADPVPVGARRGDRSHPWPGDRRRRLRDKNRSARANWWRGSMRSCGGRDRRRPRRPGRQPRRPDH